jgi:hypothetical protein
MTFGSNNLWDPKVTNIYIYIYNPKTPNELTKPCTAATEFRHLDDFEKKYFLKKGPARAGPGTPGDSSVFGGSPTRLAIIILNYGVSTARGASVSP